MNDEINSDEKPCYGCGGKRDRPGLRYCKACNDAYVGENGYICEVVSKQRDVAAVFSEIKIAARTYANACLQRGKIVKVDCEICKNPNSQMHHPDYGDPANVIWLCRACHMFIHDFK